MHHGCSHVTIARPASMRRRSYRTLIDIFSTAALISSDSSICRLASLHSPCSFMNLSLPPSVMLSRALMLEGVASQSSTAPCFRSLHHFRSQFLALRLCFLHFLRWVIASSLSVIDTVPLSPALKLASELELLSTLALRY